MGWVKIDKNLVWNIRRKPQVGLSSDNVIFFVLCSLVADEVFSTYIDWKQNLLCPLTEEGSNVVCYLIIGRLLADSSGLIFNNGKN